MPAIPPYHPALYAAPQQPPPPPRKEHLEPTPFRAASACPAGRTVCCPRTLCPLPAWARLRRRRSTCLPSARRRWRCSSCTTGRRTPRTPHTRISSTTSASGLRPSRYYHPHLPVAAVPLSSAQPLRCHGGSVLLVSSPWQFLSLSGAPAPHQTAALNSLPLCHFPAGGFGSGHLNRLALLEHRRSRYRRHGCGAALACLMCACACMAWHHL